jgi:hypothetical protein
MSRNQEKNGRDMSIAYFLVTATYMTIGAAFYVTFPLPKVSTIVADPDPVGSKTFWLGQIRVRIHNKGFGGRMPLFLLLFFFIQYSRDIHTIIHPSFINIR